jgi:hypothetical protein
MPALPGKQENLTRSREGQLARSAFIFSPEPAETEQGLRFRLRKSFGGQVAGVPSSRLRLKVFFVGFVPLCEKS